MDYKHLSEQDLKVYFNQGDRSAFQEIYDRYFQFLYLHAYRCLGCDYDARDLVHDIFLKLIARSGKLKVEVSLPVYLYSCVTNAVRSRRRHRIIEQKYLVFQLGVARYFSDSIFMEKELAGVVQQEINQLGPRMRSILECNVSGLPHQQIARLHQLEVNTVKHYIFQARRILRGKLGRLLMS